MEVFNLRYLFCRNEKIVFLARLPLQIQERDHYLKTMLEMVEVWNMLLLEQT